MTQYILETYGYLLPVHEYTSANEFAELIKNTYSLENDRNNAVYEHVVALSGTFYRTHLSVMYLD